MKKIKLTKREVELLSLEESGQKIYWDLALKGFGVRVGTQKKTYIVQRDIGGKSVRVTVGDHTLYPTDKARDIARGFLLDMSKGINPNAEKKKKSTSRISLADLYSDYVDLKKNLLKKRTLEGYRDLMKNHFFDWERRNIKEISRDMIVVRHSKISNESGPYAAKNAMTFLQVLYKFGKIDDEKLINPVEILFLKKLMASPTRRKTLLLDNQISTWFEAVNSVQNDGFRDALLLIFLTGLRKMEAFTLAWENVDFERKLFCIPDTKNNNSLELPMNNFVFELLKRRQESLGSDKWVFPGRGNNSHIIDAKKTVKYITEQTGVKFMIHDLRRTFTTAANKLSIPHATIKNLVNHSPSKDVTDGYIILDVDSLREPSQKISDRLLELAGVTNSGFNVVS